MTLIVSLVLNSAPAMLGLAFGAMALGAEDDCGQLGLWLMIQGILSVGHCCFSWYFFKVMQQPFDRVEFNSFLIALTIFYSF